MNLDEREQKRLVEIFADKYGLPREVLYGVILKESRFNPLACRFEPHYRWLFYPDQVKPMDCSLATEKTFQMTSWGLMQVMGAVFREYGFKGWLTAIPGDVEAQLDYGCKHLKKMIKRWGLEGGILAYNAGSPRKNDQGQYINQAYLDGVLKLAGNYRQIALA